LLGLNVKPILGSTRLLRIGFFVFLIGFGYDPVKIEKMKLVGGFI